MRFRVKAVMLALASAGGSPLAAEVVRTTDDSFVSRHEVVVKATPKEVWLALIAPSGWWQAAHTWSGEAKNLTLTPQAGGCFCETIPEKDGPGGFTLQGSVEHMRVIQSYPEQALRMVGSLGPLQSEPVTGVLTIAISKVEKGTRIVWEYNVGGPMRYEVPVISKAVDGVMGAQVDSLAKLLGVVAMPTSPGSASGPAAKPAEAAPATPPKPGAPAPAPLSPKPATPGAPAGAKPAAVPAATAPKPGTAPLAASVKPAATAAAGGTATPKPAPKPGTKAPSVDETFADLKDKPKP